MAAFKHVNGIISQTEYQRIKDEMLNPQFGEVILEAGKPRRVIPDLAPIIKLNERYVAYHFTHRYAGELLTERHWMCRLNYQTAEFLSIQTGGGKTTLAIEGLAKYLNGNGERLAIFMSRSALKLKTKYDAINATEPNSGDNAVISIIRNQMKSKYDGADVNMGKDMALAEIIKGLNEFGNIDIYSYQDIYGERASSKHRKKLEEKLVEYGAVIFDECHFFASDADFNVYTEKIFSYLTRIFFQHEIPRIYMSATPEYVFDWILKREIYMRDNGPIRIECAPRINICYPPAPVLNLYYFDRDYSYINFNTFSNKKPNDFSEIISYIDNKDNSANVKWLIFIDNKDLGWKIKSAIKNRNVAMLNSDMIHKGNENEGLSEDVDRLMWSLTKEEKLPDDVDVLITTKCLDVGITIKDSPLNIVCFLNDPVDFIQAVGRKRICNKNDIVNLYIPYYPNGTISKWLYQARKKYGEYENLRGFQGNMANGTEVPRPIYIDNGKYQFNDFAIGKIMEQMAAFEDMKKRTCDGEEDGKAIAQYFADLMETLYEPEIAEAGDMFSEAALDELRKIVKKYAVSPITDEHRKEMIEELKKYDCRARTKDRDLGTEAINKIIVHVGYKMNKISSKNEPALYQLKQI